MATIKLMKEVKFINTYSFVFSARPGTPAFNLTKINSKDAKERLITFMIGNFSSPDSVIKLSPTFFMGNPVFGEQYKLSIFKINHLLF